MEESKGGKIAVNLKQGKKEMKKERAKERTKERERDRKKREKRRRRRRKKGRKERGRDTGFQSCGHQAKGAAVAVAAACLFRLSFIFSGPRRPSLGKYQGALTVGLQTQ